MARRSLQPAEFHLRETDFNIHTQDVLAYHREEEAMLDTAFTQDGIRTAIEFGVGPSRLPIALAPKIDKLDGIEKYSEIARKARREIREKLSPSDASKVQIFRANFLTRNDIAKIRRNTTAKLPYGAAIFAFNVLGNVPKKQYNLAISHAAMLAESVIGSVWSAEETNREINRRTRAELYDRFGQEIPDDFMETGLILNPEMAYTTRDFTIAELNQVLSAGGVKNISIKEAPETGHFLFFSGDLAYK